MHIHLQMSYTHKHTYAQDQTFLIFFAGFFCKLLAERYIVDWVFFNMPMCMQPYHCQEKGNDSNVLQLEYSTDPNLKTQTCFFYFTPFNKYHILFLAFLLIVYNILGHYHTQVLYYMHINVAFPKHSGMQTQNSRVILRVWQIFCI